MAKTSSTGKAAGSRTAAKATPGGEQEHTPEQEQTPGQAPDGDTEPAAEPTDAPSGGEQGDGEGNTAPGAPEGAQSGQDAPAGDHYGRTADPTGVSGGGGTFPYSPLVALTGDTALAVSSQAPTEPPPLPEPRIPGRAPSTSDSVAAAAKVHSQAGHVHEGLVDENLKPIESLDDVIDDDGVRATVTIKRRVLQAYRPPGARTVFYHLLYAAGAEPTRVDVARLKYALVDQAQQRDAAEKQVQADRDALHARMKASEEDQKQAAKAKAGAGK